MMDQEILKELAEESKDLFDRIEREIDELPHKNDQSLIDSLNRDINSIAGAAEMFGLDHITRSLQDLGRTVNQNFQEQNFSEENINKIRGMFDASRKLLTSSQDDNQYVPIVTIRSYDDASVKDEDVFPVKLYSLENDRYWEYKHIMQELSGLNITEVKTLTGTEEGILIAAPEAVTQANVQATNQLLFILIGSDEKEEENVYSLPKSVDPAAILAVCRIIYRLKSASGS